MLGKEAFDKGLKYLAMTFGGFHSVHSDKTMQEMWYCFCKQYSDERFLELITYYCAHAERHPVNFEQMRRFWQDNHPAPGESVTTSDRFLASSEMKMSVEERQANLKRLKVLTKVLVGSKGFPNKQEYTEQVLQAPVSSLESISEVFDRPAVISVLNACYEENGRMVLPPDLTLAEARSLLKAAIEGKAGNALRDELLYKSVIGWARGNDCDLIQDKSGKIIDLDVRF